VSTCRAGGLTCRGMNGMCAPLLVVVVDTPADINPR
jgi:hypothetical protein